MIYFAFGRELRRLYFDILDTYEQFILFVWFYFEKMWKFSEKQPFFRADMAGLGKYHMGGYGRIGVYRVKYMSLKVHSHFVKRKQMSSHISHVFMIPSQM